MALQGMNPGEVDPQAGQVPEVGETKGRMMTDTEAYDQYCEMGAGRPDPEEIEAREWLESQGIDVDAEWRMLMQKLEERGVIGPPEVRQRSDRFINEWDLIRKAADACETIVTAVTGDPDQWDRMPVSGRQNVASAVLDAMRIACTPRGADVRQLGEICWACGDHLEGVGHRQDEQSRRIRRGRTSPKRPPPQPPKERMTDMEPQPVTNQKQPSRRERRWCSKGDGHDGEHEFTERGRVVHIACVDCEESDLISIEGER